MNAPKPQSSSLVSGAIGLGPLSVDGLRRPRRDVSRPAVCGDDTEVPPAPRG